MNNPGTVPQPPMHGLVDGWMCVRDGTASFVRATATDRRRPTDGGVAGGVHCEWRRRERCCGLSPVSCEAVAPRTVVLAWARQGLS